MLLGQKWHKLYVQDIELSRLNGGLGLVFWAFCFPLWGLLFLRSIKRIKKRFVVFWFWLQILLAFPFVLSWSVQQIDYTVRYVIYIVPLGLVALGMFLDVLKRNDFSVLLKLFKVMAMIAAFLSMTLMSICIWPQYNLKSALTEIDGNGFSYLKNAPWYVGSNYFIWELIEEISRSHGRGLSCYIASEKDEFYTAPLYGLNLQNTIYNFQRHPVGMPDVLFFNFESYYPSGKLTFVGKRIDMMEVRSNPEYVVVFAMFKKFVFVKKQLLSDPNIAACLNKFYRKYFPNKEDS
jgi:hypothetical protein